MRGPEPRARITVAVSRLAVPLPSGGQPMGIW